MQSEEAKLTDREPEDVSFSYTQPTYLVLGKYRQHTIRPR